MSRLLERETSPPRVRTERTLYRLSCRGSCLLEKEGRGQRTCFARFSSKKRIVFECSTNVSVFCPFDDVAWIPPRPQILLYDFSDSHSRGFTLSHSLFLSVSSASIFLLPALDSSPNREYRPSIPTFFYAD